MRPMLYRQRPGGRSAPQSRQNRSIFEIFNHFEPFLSSRLPSVARRRGRRAAGDNAAHEILSAPHGHGTSRSAPASSCLRPSRWSAFSPTAPPSPPARPKSKTPSTASSMRRRSPKPARTSKPRSAACASWCAISRRSRSPALIQAFDEIHRASLNNLLRIESSAHESVRQEIDGLAQPHRRAQDADSTIWSRSRSRSASPKTTESAGACGSPRRRWSASSMKTWRG